VDHLNRAGDDAYNTLNGDNRPICAEHIHFISSGCFSSLHPCLLVTLHACALMWRIQGFEGGHSENFVWRGRTEHGSEGTINEERLPGPMNDNPLH